MTLWLTQHDNGEEVQATPGEVDKKDDWSDESDQKKAEVNSEELYDEETNKVYHDGY